MKKVLVIGTHPDDEVLGAGGTVAKLVSLGYEVFHCIVSEGATSRYDEAMVDVLNEHSQKAGKVLGVTKTFNLNFPNQRLETLEQIKINNALREIVLEVKPKIVFTQHHGDVNMNHRLVFEATMVACRPVGDFKVEELYTYEVLSSTEWAPPYEHKAFTPNVYVDISETLDKKIKAMKQYQSEMIGFPHPRSAEAIEIHAKKRGLEVGFNAAEAFYLIRKLSKEGF